MSKMICQRNVVGLGVLFCAVVFPAFAQVAPPLGGAGDFAVLGGSTVTNTGATTVTGDVGVSPGTAITGFPPGTLTGTLHSNDAVAQAAQTDLTTAYNALAGQACNTDLTGTDLGGLTLTSAVYCFSSSAQLTGTLTLDAQGDPNAVFIFQIGSSLTTASAASVVVINGGSDCNVFWQVGSSETLGTGSAFVGNTLALTSITLTTSATSHGSLLARNGAVTMDTNQIGVCAPSTPVTMQSFIVD
ncbi:MAG: ice-binding family protein [Rhodanobacteraceae bacterium]